MKSLALILLLASPCFGQLLAPKDTVYSFSKQEVVNLTNLIHRQNARLAAADNLLSLFTKRDVEAESSIKAKQDIINLQDKQLQLAHKNDSLYHLELQALQPTWFDKYIWHNPVVLVSLGIVLGVVFKP